MLTLRFRLRHSTPAKGAGKVEASIFLLGIAFGISTISLIDDFYNCIITRQYRPNWAFELAFELATSLVTVALYWWCVTHARLPRVG